MVKLGPGTNKAVTVVGPDTVKFCDAAVPDTPLNPVNVYPGAAVAVTVTVAPGFNHSAVGVTLPPTTGLAKVVR
jgi:hypothetical protein